MSAKTNIAKLPESCYHVLNTTGELIKIKSGEKGYYKLGQSLPKRDCDDQSITMDELADNWNNDIGVTKAQRSAMDWGSMFGWEVGLADADSEEYKDL